MRLFLSNSDAPPNPAIPPEILFAFLVILNSPVNKYLYKTPKHKSSYPFKTSSFFLPSRFKKRKSLAINKMAAPAESKQEDMFQSIGDRVNEVAGSGNGAEGDENFTVDEPQIVDNIGMFTITHTNLHRPSHQSSF